MNFLKKLFGKKEEPVELPPEFLQEDAPDWLVELKGTDLRGTGVLSVRVTIHNGPRTGTAEVWLLTGAEGQEPRQAGGALERTEIDRLLVILGFSFPADIASVSGGTEMGAAASIVIHRREPYAMKTGECALSGWMDSRKAGPPVVEVGRILMEAQKRILDF